MTHSFEQALLVTMKEFRPLLLPIVLQLENFNGPFKETNVNVSPR